MPETNPHDVFREHVIKRQDERSILLQNPNNSDMWCTIAIDDLGQIVVFGDFGPIVFGFCAVPFAHRIGWLGSHEEADSYVLAKARIGMSNLRDALTVTSAESFEADVRQEFAVRLKALEDIGDEGASDSIRDGLTWEAFGTYIDLGELEVLQWSALPAQRALYSYLEDLGYQDNWEWIGSLGERPIPSIGLAHAALRRAHLLLKADEVPS